MSNNLVLGRGKLYFDRFAPGTQTKTGERYLGSTPSFSVTAETVELEHFSAEEGLRIKDESVTTQIDFTGQFVTENISPENIALFFLGSSEVLSQAAATGVEESFTVSKGLFYQLGATALKPEGVEKVSNVVVEPGGGGTAFVAGTDYAVDLDLGRIEILPGGAIANGATIDVTYNRVAASQERVISGTTLIQGAMRFISFNGVGGQKNFYMPKVTLRPNGEFALKGEEWQQFGFNVEILQAGNLANLFVSGRAVATP